MDPRMILVQSGSDSGSSDSEGLRNLDAESLEDVVDDICKEVQGRFRKDGLLKTYYKPDEVDCSGAKKVYMDVRPHDLKRIDDAREQFGLVFVLQLWWMDPDLRDFPSKLVLRKPDAPGDVPYIQEIDVVVRRLDLDGTLTYEELPHRHGRRTAKKDEYVYLHPPAWKYHFFPKYTIMNKVFDEEAKEDQAFEPELLWCNEEGGFVQCRVRYDTTFEEPLELNTFPVDRQLCRLKITAEMPVEEFQFITLDTCRRLAKIQDMWEVDPDHQCVVYVRHPDEHLPGGMITQRSLVNVVLHVQRQPDFFFHSVAFMVMLINIISLCSFAIRPHYSSGRLSFLITCFLAVVAYRYIVNDSLPRKSYMTSADVYITFACLFQTAQCLWTSGLMVGLRMTGGYDERSESWHWVLILDAAFGGLCLLCLILSHAWLKTGAFRRKSWREVYDFNKEPFMPVEECSSCGSYRLSLQCRHADKTKACQVCGAKSVVTRYLEPMKSEPFTVVPSLTDRLLRLRSHSQEPDPVEAYLEKAERLKTGKK